MGSLKPELMEHFNAVMLTTASRLQSWNVIESHGATQSEANPCDDFGEELLACIESMPIPQVNVGDIQVITILIVPLLVYVIITEGQCDKEALDSASDLRQ